MDLERARAGDEAYAAGDWTTAAREYIAASGESADGAGALLHKAGNALLKLRRLDDAVIVYERSLDDEGYEGRAAVRINLGTAYAVIGANDKAVTAFEAAISDPTCATKHKALVGLGAALFDLGRHDESADAYRKAALDPRNPDPGRALNNLGLCYMGLERPEDAVEAYRAAVELKGYQGRGRAAANLGLAYAALGMHDHAVRIFERAEREFGHELSHAAAAAHAACAAVAEEGREKVDGWSTGEMPPVMSVAGAEDKAAETPFFTITDDEMRTVDREVQRTERRQRRAARPVWLIATIAAVTVALLVGLAAFGWYSGLGYPTQRMTVDGLMAAYSSGQSVERFWVAVPSADVQKEMSIMPPVWRSVEVGAVEGSARTSTVDLVVTLEQGAPLNYRVSLVREGVGWKVNGITNDWRSTGGGS